MVETEIIGGRIIASEPMLTGCLEQGECADDIGAQELLGKVNGTIDVRFGSKMDHCINFMQAKQVIHQWTVADIASHKSMTIRSWKIFQIFLAACIGQDIQVDDMDIWFCQVGGQAVLGRQL